jgi:8-oxo-dGTP pyrophosphatase MutT (NUDIX family)
MSENYCNNCGKGGHLFHQCKTPITSIGIIVFRVNQNYPPGTHENNNSFESRDLMMECTRRAGGGKGSGIRFADSDDQGGPPRVNQGQNEYLMIRRKDSLGYIDFMRGKYSVFNKYYILNMLKQMTVLEKERLGKNDFDFVWGELWGHRNVSLQYKNEEVSSRDKYNILVNGVKYKDDFYTLADLIEESNRYDIWEETEWGFPKGRRNYQEKDFDCALREFSEETGYSVDQLQNVQNIIPYEEIFMGSNYKIYKHKYYLMYMDFENTIDTTKFETSEVSKMEWKPFQECVDSIRSYNLEKKRLLAKIHNALTKYSLYSTASC